MNRYWKTSLTDASGRIGMLHTVNHLFNQLRYRKSLRKAWAAFAFVLLLPIVPLFGQASGSVSGTVVDASGAAIAGVDVSVTQLDTGGHTTVVTDSSGRYAFSSLPLLTTG